LSSREAAGVFVFYKEKVMSVSRKMAWIMWMTSSIFYAYQYIMRVMPNIMIEDIMQQYQMDAALFGQFSGIYYIGYVLMHLPIGIMLDRIGPKKVMTGCMLLIVCGLLPVVISDNWIYPIIGRLLIGMGSSAAILGVFKIIRLSFAEQRFARMLGFSVTIGLLGAIYGGGPVAQMCDSLGYKVVTEIFAGLGIVLAGVTYFIVPELQSNNQETVIADLKAVFTNHKLLAVCFLAGLLVGPIEGFADVWGAEFLKQEYGFDPIATGYLTSLIYVGMCFGGPFLGIITEKTGQYLDSIIGAGLVMLVVFMALVAGLLTVSSMTIGFALVGVCCFYQILAIYKASTYVPNNLVGLATAVANMIIMSFGYVFHSVIGFVINAYGGAGQAFVYGISVIPIALGIGTMGFIILSYQEKKRLVYQL
jgi:MFS family permease